MDPGELLSHVASVLARLELRYFVTGSTATIAYGEPRFTNDIDLVLDLPAGRIKDLVESFPGPEFYLAEEAIQGAIRRRSSFNLIHPTSGLKVDFMVAESSAFNRSRFQRVRSLEVGASLPIPFASPEDVILKKLEYHREGGSQKHLRDIAGVLRTTTAPELDYPARWAAELGVLDEWEVARKLA